MEQGRYSQVKAGLESLLNHDVEDLNGLSDDIREDGIPENWVSDCPNLTAGQKAELRSMLLGREAQWCQSLHNHLLV